MNNLGILLIMLVYVTKCQVGMSPQQKNTSQLSPSPYQSQNKHLQVGQQYTFKIKPKSFLIILINSTRQDDIVMDYITTFPFETCIINTKGICKYQSSKHKTHQGSIQLSYRQISSGIKVTNPHQTLFIKVYLRFHEIKNGCHPLSAKLLYRKQLSDDFCLVHNIEEDKDLQIMLQTQTFSTFNYKFLICNKQKILIQQQSHRFIVDHAMIAENCNGINQKTIIIKASKQQNISQQEYLNVVLEYPSQGIILMDGIGYTTTLKSNSPRVFLYELVNKIDTMINVQAKSSVEIFAKIVEEQFMEDTVPSQQDHIFSSKGGFIFTYNHPYIKITEQEMKIIKCQDCFIVIAVYLSQQAKRSQDQITVQVSQHQSLLINGIIKHKFLPTNSTAYYRYESDRQKIIYLQISDNNQYCTEVYFSDHQNPSQSNHILKYDKKQIIYQAKQNQNYYIRVEAKENCAYSIGVYDSTNNITYLQKGRFGFLNLEEGQSKVYLIASQNSKYLKFLSMQVYGGVEIYLNRTTLQQINNIKSSSFNYSSFEKKGQFRNSLILERQQTMFCDRCYFLVAVVANKHTQSTLFYGDESTPIPIRDKKIHDIIPKKGTIVKGQYYGQVKSAFEVRVRSGRLRIRFINENKQYEKIINQSEEVYKDKFNLEIKKENFLNKIISLFSGSPIKVQFQALEDNTIYSLLIRPLEQDDANDQQTNKIRYKNISITAGEEQYEEISKDQILCISGHLRQNNERVIITSDYSKRQLLSLITVQGEVKNKNSKVKVQKVQNILTISFPQLSNYLMTSGVQFNLFLSTNYTQFSVYIIQEQQFSVLPSQVNVLIDKEYTFITHIQPNLIIDIFQCSAGQSSIAYGSNRKDIDQHQKKQLQLARLSNQPHAIKITTYFTTFFKIKTNKAVMRWFPFNLQKKIGTGYIDYQIGHLIYKSVFGGLQLTWKSLSSSKNTTSKIVNITYNLFISFDEGLVKTASQCQIMNQANIYSLSNIIKSSSTLKLNTNHTYILNKEILSGKFIKKPIFVTIVADAEIQPQASNLTQSTQRYRFLYPIIEIPEEMLVASYIDRVNHLNFSQILVLILVATLLIVVILYFILMKLVPLIGMLQNRWLVEEQELQPNPRSQAQQGFSEVPPSSDRKGNIHTTEVADKDEYIEAK